MYFYIDYYSLFTSESWHRPNTCSFLVSQIVPSCGNLATIKFVHLYHPSFPQHTNAPCSLKLWTFTRLNWCKCICTTQPVNSPA